MLEAKDAVKASLTTFPQLFHEETFRDLRLEEIALARDNHIWDITVSYRNPDREEEIRVKRVQGSNALSLLGTKIPEIHTRHYKSLSISAEDGSLVQVKNA